MAQGRVPHLMEWKGWRAPPTEEVLYEELADQLKEARFAAGEGGREAGASGDRRGHLASILRVCSYWASQR